MPDPSSPDRSLSDLLSSLDDNNSGAITPEDVRSIVAFNRPSTASIGSSGIGASALKDLFTNSGGEAYYKLPTSLSNGLNVGYILLSELVDVAGSGNYDHHSGHVVLSRSSATGGPLGLRYDNPSDDPQPRIFTYEWDITIQSSEQSFWAVTFFYLPSGTNWGQSNTSGGWTASRPAKIEVHHSEPIFGDKVREVNGDEVWQTSSTGSRSIILNPGDTIVPVLEYWGLPAGNTDDVSMIETAGCTVNNFAFRATSQGVVTEDWDDDYDGYWSVENNRSKTQYVLSDRAANTAPDSDFMYTISCTSTTRPADARPGQMIYETDTGNTLIYINSFLGWSRPWNQPWGAKGTQVSPSSPGGPSPSRTDGFPAAGSATSTDVSTGFQITVPVVNGRRYKVRVQGHTYANGNYAGFVGKPGNGAPTEGSTSGQPTSIDGLPVGMIEANATGGGANDVVVSGSALGPGNLLVDGGFRFKIIAPLTVGARVYETETSLVSLYDDSTSVAATSTQSSGPYATAFTLEYTFDATAGGTKTFDLRLSRTEGNNTHFLFHSPSTDRPVILTAEDLGPAVVDGSPAIPPTS